MENSSLKVPQSTTSKMAPEEEKAVETLEANKKEVPVKLDIWKKNIEFQLKPPFDNTKRTELKKLMNTEVVNKQSGELKGNDALNKVFGELLTTALILNDMGPAKILIGSQYFKWDYKLDDIGTTALHQAVKSGKDEIVKRIASVYTEALDARDKFGYTPLHYAAQKGSQEPVQILLDNGANVDAFNQMHQTPLHKVAMNLDNIATTQQVAVAKELLRHGAEVNTRDYCGDSPLHDAARDLKYANGSPIIDLLQILIRFRADVECRNHEDQTPQDTLPGTISDSLELYKLFTEPPEKSTEDKSLPIPKTKPQCWNSISKNDLDYKVDAGIQGPQNLDRDVCWRFFAHVHFFYREQEYSWARSISIHELIHSDGNKIQALEDQFVDLVSKRFHKKTSEMDEIREKTWKWIHIPDNQMSWVRDLVWCLTDDKLPGEDKETPQKRKYAWDFLERNIAQRKGVRPNSFARVPHAGDLSKSSSSSEQSTDKASVEILDRRIEEANESADLYKRYIWRNTANIADDQRISIVVPYIDIESEKYLQRHDKIGDKYKIETQRFRNMRELERKSLQYKGLSGLYLSQTLDQSFYAMIGKKDLDDRNRDQIVYKWTKSVFNQEAEEKKRKEEGNKKGEELGEPEINKKVTKPDKSNKAEGLKNGTHETGKKKKEKPEKPENSQDSFLKLLMVNQLWLWKLDKDTVITAFPDRYHQGTEYTLLETIRQGDIQFYTSPEQLVENILFKCVSFPEEFRDAGMGIHVLDIFETALAKRSNDEAKCFKEFAEEHGKARYRLAQDIDTEMKTSHEVRDICDELHLLLRIFETQQDVIKKFAAMFWSDEKRIRYSKAFVQDCGLNHLIERTKNLDERAQRTISDLDFLVQMKQAQGSLDEAKTAGQMNTYILFFTLVTIVFTPLSFMTSLFAMPLDSLPKQDNDTELTSKWTTGRMFAGELATFVGMGIGYFVYYVKENYRESEFRKKWSRWINWTSRKSSQNDSEDEENAENCKFKLPWIRKRKYGNEIGMEP